MTEVEKLAQNINIILYIFMAIVSIVFIARLCGFGVDDSDKSAWNRSGMKIRTDAKTGLQYFEGEGGGLTPRLNLDGSYMEEKDD